MMETPRQTWLLLGLFSLALLVLVFASAAPTGAQANPTPVVITVTPTGGPTVTPTATAGAAPGADHLEPNDSAETAAEVGFGTETDLTLAGEDVDYVTGYLKAGQRLQLSTAVRGGLDTRLDLFWHGELVAESDDRAPDDPGSEILWTAPSAGWFVARVTKATVYAGAYDLTMALAAPPATATSTPTATPSPTPAATPTVAPTEAASGHASDQTRPLTSVSTDPAGPTPTPAVTATLTATSGVSLTIRHLGRVTPAAEATTHVRLLVYYDANSDRAPGPGEGVPDVSVLAVDAQGRQLARVFTSGQGEAVFTLQDAAVARVVVPFVPGWSARVRPGQVNEGLVLGLPAVRLPVFLPLAASASEEE